MSDPKDKEAPEGEDRFSWTDWDEIEVLPGDEDDDEEDEPGQSETSGAKPNGGASDA